MTGFRKQSSPSPGTAASPENERRSDVEVLQAQVQSLESTLLGLQEQMQASSELIKALADQNTQLVQRIEMNRVRLMRMGAVGGIVALALLVATVYLLLRH